jgi:hypothetical protein
MPLPSERGPNAFVAAKRIYVDSSERSSGTVSDYLIDLPNDVLNLVSLELTGFMLPTAMTPTFRDNVNNAIDFRLTRGAVTKTFAAFMPSFSFTYQNVAVPYLDFLRGVEQVLMNAIALDADFGVSAATPAIIFTTPDPEQKLRVGVSNATLALLFGSGVNKHMSAYQVLGFREVDYGPAVDILSPFPSLLEPFRKIEIFIEQIGTRSVAVVYNGNAAFSGQNFNETNSRMRFLDDSPPRRLSKLSIHVRVDGEKVEDRLDNEHSLSVTALYFVYNETVPRWLNQINTL